MNIHSGIQHEIELVFVDLDGTLSPADALYESAMALIRHKPWMLFALLYWAIGGKRVLKARLARRAMPDIAAYPFKEPLIERLRQLKAGGAEIVLATAAHWKVARRIAARFKIFDAVIASGARRNLKGKAKLAAIQNYAAGRRFHYAGNSRADRHIWSASAGAIFVAAPKAAIAASIKSGQPFEVFERSESPLRAFMTGMRLHQWVKNALIFVPLLTAHAYFDSAAIAAAAIAFASFGLVASGTYFLNDLLDLDADRNHRTKRHRPLASGDLPIVWGIAGAAILPIAGFAIALAALPWQFGALLASYLFLTNAYSFKLKRVSTADVMTLAALFTLRLISGAAAIGAVLSFWLFAFSIFVFVSLAYLKRYVELAGSRPAGERSYSELGRSALENSKIGGRNYWASDAETTFSLGTANTTGAVVVLALFVNTPEVATQYRTPEALWMLCFLMLYWTNRLWVGARRGKIHDDPVAFALKDRVSQLIGLGFAATLIFARYVAV